MKMKLTATATMVMASTLLLGSPPPAQAQGEQFGVGSWRIVSRADRRTIGEVSAGVLGGANYAGNKNQHWHMEDLGNSRYRFRHDKTGKCLGFSSGVANLASCGTTATNWRLETIRTRSESRPAVFRLISSQGTSACLVPNGTAKPIIGTCDDKARLYIEPVGWGERPTAAVQHEMNALLLVKPETNVPGLSSGVLSSSLTDAVQQSFKVDVPAWLKRITDGRVVMKPTTRVSSSAITSLYLEGGNYLPRPQNVPDNINTIAPRGTYDTVQVFFTPGESVPGGGGWGPGSSHRSNYAFWTTVNGKSSVYGSTEAWLSTGTNSEPAEIFIHEPMHGYDRHYQNLGLPLPAGLLHGGPENLYADSTVSGQSWLHWQRDYWLGTVIAADDTYRGYGPRMFRMATPRKYAAGPHKIVHKSSGKCVTTQNGSLTPAQNTPAVLSTKCSDNASSFTLLSNGMLKHSSGLCLHPEGGTANNSTKLVFFPSCTAETRLMIDVVDGANAVPQYGSLKNVQTGRCVHPSGGSSNPAEGTVIVYFDGCNESRLRFDFVLK